MSASNPTDSAATATASVWKEYKNQEGRPYWFNTVDKKSVWDKPLELKSPRERAIASTKWKEYKSGERNYYVHSETKETTWIVPKELQDLFDALPGNEPTSSTLSVPTAASASSSVSPAHRSTAAASPAAPRAGAPPGNDSPAPSAPGPAPGPPPAISTGPSGNLTPGGTAVRPIYSGPPPGFGPPGPPPGPAPIRPPPSGPTAQFAGSPQPPLGPSNAGFAPTPVFDSPEEAFRSLLQNKGVTTSSTWEQTMRDIVTDPLYKALRSLAERKAVFNEYQTDLRKQQAEERSKKREQVKPSVLEVFRATASQGKLKEFSSWRTVLKHLKDQSAVRSAISEIGEEDVKQFWEEVRKELKSASEGQQRELRHRNMDLLMSLLRTFEADTTTRWRDAHRTVIESSEWKQDAHLSTMDLSDMIIVFDEYIRSIEREEGERRKSEEKKRARDERKRREAFRKLMAQGREEGWIHSKTMWPEVYGRIKDDERFKSMLGQRGSSPLDLFFDVLDACNRSIEGRIAAVEGLIRLGDAEWDRIDPESTWEIFVEKVQSGLAKAQQIGQGDKWSSVASVDQELKLVFDELVAVSARAAREARKRHERHVRHLIDDARYGLKKAADDELITKAENAVPFEEMSSQIEALNIREWQRLDEDINNEAERQEVKKTTWEKFCRRQKEKAAERQAAEAAAADFEASRKAAMNGHRGQSREKSTEPALKRKSEANEYDERERERARRREDRDSRRRGGRDDIDRDRDRERERRSSRRDADDGKSDERKRSTRERAPSESHPTSSTLQSEGAQGAVDDDDKEEGEV
ncbi:unnamed protein product [Sympodiomycopsis kandeliae]